MSSLQDKVIVVTGGSGLIGSSIINRLCKDGAICINADLNGVASGSEIVKKCNVTDSQSVDYLIENLMTEYGRIDGWVNNAYPRTADWGAKFEDVTLDSWRNNLDMQLSSIFYISQKVLAIMQQQKYGSMVNIASIYGIVGNDFTIYENTGGLTSPAAYSAIKGGLINFTRYLASYYGKYGVRINCVSPGGIIDKQHPNFIEQYSAKVPLRRLGKPAEISPGVSFLLSEDASYITGNNLVIDGGWTSI
jgi:NAD(P)-dependent dehydrogenase (short-subunit alcohol dehydrogenase family)